MRYLLLSMLFATLFSLPTGSVAEEAPLRLELSIPRSTYLGGRATLQILVRNMTSREVDFDAPPGGMRAEAHYRLTFCHEDGRIVPLTAYGRALNQQSLGPDDPANNFVIGGSSMIVHLAPEEFFRETIELGDIFQIDEAGRYEVTIEREFPTQPAAGTIKSNTLTMTVH
jgi:hypothetical protein